METWNIEMQHALVTHLFNGQAMQLRHPPLPHQHEGIHRLYELERLKGKVILADDMGLGKTFQVLAVISRTQYEPGVTLVVCPPGLMTMWRQQILKHTTLPSYAILEWYGKSRKKGRRPEFQLDPKIKIVITTFRAVDDECPNRLLKVSEVQRWEAGIHKGSSRVIPMDQCGMLIRQRWKRLVVDEAHMVRNPKSRNLRAICSISANYRWVVSGTLFNNATSDLAAMCELLGLQPQNDSKWWSKASASAIRGFREQYMIRRPNTVIELPSKTRSDVTWNLSEQERKTYVNLLKQSCEDYNRMKRMGMDNAQIYQRGVVLLLRLRQCCSDESLTQPVHLCIDCKDDVKNEKTSRSFGPKAKTFEMSMPLPCQRHFRCVSCQVETDAQGCSICDGTRYKSSSRTVRLVDELQAQRRKDPTNAAMVFSQWSSYLTRVEVELKQRGLRSGVDYLRLDGSVGKKQRDEIISSFQNSTGPPILLSTYTGGVGLTLVRANYVYIMDLWYNPQVELQAIARIHRFGQCRQVHEIHVKSDMLVEELIADLQHSKVSNADFYVTGTVEERPDASAGISFRELRKVFQDLNKSLQDEETKIKRGRMESEDLPSAKRQRTEVTKMEIDLSDADGL